MEQKKAFQQKSSKAKEGYSFRIWQETQKHEVGLCLVAVLGDGSFKRDVVKVRRRLTTGKLGSGWKETWIQTHLGFSSGFFMA